MEATARTAERGCVIMTVYCCKGCVAPKRHPGCHDHCPEYIAEKEEHDRIKAEHDRERDIRIGIYGNRSKKVYNAMKYRRNKKM